MHLGAGLRGELAPPFDAILGDELRRRAAIAEADAATRVAVKEALRQRHAQVGTTKEQRPQGILAGADSPTALDEVVGWSQNNMVELNGHSVTWIWPCSGGWIGYVRGWQRKRRRLGSRSLGGQTKAAGLGAGDRDAGAARC